MRLAVYVLAALVFAAALVIDTGALLALAGGFLWAHATTTAAAALLLIAVVAAWKRLRPQNGPKTRGPPRQARRAAGPRQQRAIGGRGRSPTGKRARAR
jgi:membrane protein implicated in regulation of membrane protease activity